MDFLYLWVVLTLFALHESIVLAKHDIDYRGYGLAFINAFVLAKVMLVADELNLGRRWFRQRRPIYRILYRSALFALVLVGAHVAEGIATGWWRGKALLESFPEIGGGSVAGILSVGVIVSVALMPFFAFREVQQALGSDVLRRVLLGARSTVKPRGVVRT